MSVVDSGVKSQYFVANHKFIGGESALIKARWYKKHVCEICNDKIS